MTPSWILCAVLSAFALEGCVVDIGEIRFADGDATVSDGGLSDARDATKTGPDALDVTPDVTLDVTPDEPFDAPSDVALDVIETGPLPPDAADVTDVPDVDAFTDGPRDLAPDGCAAGLFLCAGACVDLTTDSAHCGVCGRICPSGVCTGGVCQPCTAPRIMCGTACVDLNTDPAHCGMCAAACLAGRRCVGGACTL